jgi:nucleoside-diphosphate-sugar epimerase
MPTTKRTALVTGASGLAGSYMLTHLLEQGGWDVIAVSRRKPKIPGDYRYIAVDLLDPADCQAKLGPLTNISHLFYLAITERPDPGETISANANMFLNLVKTVAAASPALEHVHLSQGTRWYGNHLGPYKTPTREDDPRHMPPNFYYDQQDFLEEFQKGTLDLVGGASARGLRIFHGRTDEPDSGDRCLCQRLQGIGAASQLPRQARRVYRALPVYGRRAPGKGRRVDGNRSEMRQSGVQHHQQ